MNNSEICKVLVYCLEHSTRMLLEVSVDRNKYDIEHVNDLNGFLGALMKKTHGIFVFDASTKSKDARYAVVKKVIEMKPKGMTRLLILVDEVPPEGSTQLGPFGPLGFIECFFNRERLNGVLDRMMEIKDTGARVKTDPKFFDITKLVSS